MNHIFFPLKQSIRPYYHWHFLLQIKPWLSQVGKAVVDIVSQSQRLRFNIKYLKGGIGRKNKTLSGEMLVAVSNLDAANKERVFLAFQLSLLFVSKCFWIFPGYETTSGSSRDGLSHKLLDWLSQHWPVSGPLWGEMQLSLPINSSPERLPSSLCYQARDTLS